MSKYLSALLAGALGLSALTSPCSAASGDKADLGSDSTAVLTATAMLPVRIVAVASAFAIGTPIALVRCQAKHLGQYGDAMVSELNANQFITPLMVASVPGQSLQIVGAVGEGLIDSCHNAARAWQAPFTAKSFSLDGL